MMTTEEWNDKPTGNATVARLYTKAELQAAIAAAMMKAVKPLVWCDLHKDGCTFVPRENFNPFHFSATISLRHSGAWHFAGNLFPTLEAAKAAAKADYQARILSALSIPTDPMAALEAVKAEAEKRGRGGAFKDSIDRIRKLRGDGWESSPAVHPYDKGYLAALDAMSRTIRAMKEEE